MDRPVMTYVLDDQCEPVAEVGAQGVQGESVLLPQGRTAPDPQAAAQQQQAANWVLANWGRLRMSLLLQRRLPGQELVIELRDGSYTIRYASHEDVQQSCPPILKDLTDLARVTQGPAWFVSVWMGEDWYSFAQSIYPFPSRGSA